ncbi:MAG TPA: hypothetical protein VGP26_17735 [Actinophytocola sp.]|nr:hypothetical protein [Actinophytocola sp.]
MRYGPQQRRTVGAVASWLVGVFIAAVLVRGMVAGSLTVPVTVAGLLLLALWALLWWRYRQRGVYVSHSRIWLSSVFRTRSVPLNTVTVVDAMPSKPAGVRRLVLHLEDGRHLTAPLRGYARGQDDPSGPLDVLPSAQFTRVLNDLQRRAAAAA